MDRQPDWVILRTEGRGRFCGVMLHVWNPQGGWWGEGDEKFFVDGEKFPSTFGTGTEDYFGYAWCCYNLFQKPFHCQTMSEENKGNQSVLRWQIADNIPFQSSFEGCMEKYYPDSIADYACTSYWYLSPEGTDPYGAVPMVDRDSYFTVPTIVAGMEIIRPFGGLYVRKEVMDLTCRDNDQLRWEVGIGANISFLMPMKPAGKYRLDVGLMKASLSPIVQFYFDGKKIGEPMDLYNPDSIFTKVILGDFNMTAEKHILTVECVGTNPQIVKRHGIHVGFDYIDVIPINLPSLKD